MPKRRARSGPASWWKYERRTDKLASRAIFIQRMFGSFGIALCVIAFGLTVGISGYHFIAGLNWIDSLLEASMILGGMGPVKELHDDASKIFASIYALFSGLVVIGLMGIMLSPVVHRVLHKFHVDEEDVE
ncbi:MAG TPA: hypothetical protein VKD91_12460 [Pyrinomonadaceae bacterium]|nr:hypothetical protein [Pyrinomonadaceae bacterium]